MRSSQDDPSVVERQVEGTVGPHGNDHASNRSFVSDVEVVPYGHLRADRPIEFLRSGENGLVVDVRKSDACAGVDEL